MKDLRRFITFDRDGTLIRDKHYLRFPSQVEWYPETFSALTQLQDSGFEFIVVTNQSGVARGLFTPEEVEAVHAFMDKEFKLNGIQVAGYFFCPHDPEAGCSCRKPETGLWDIARQELGGTIQACWVLGDKASDVAFGKNIGARTILLNTGHGRDWAHNEQASPDYQAENLVDAAGYILSQSTSHAIPADA